MSDTDKVKNIKTYLFDATLGPIPIAQEMVKEIQVLMDKLLKFEIKMNEYNQKLTDYIKSSGSMMEEVNRLVGTGDKRVERLTKARDDAYDSWLDYTIAAASSAVGCLLVGALFAPATGGTSLLYGAAIGAAVGTGLGIKAAEFRAEYSAYCKELTTAETDVAKKRRLRTDLVALNTQMKTVGPAMAGFVKNLQGVSGVWTKMNADLIDLGNNVNEGNVGSIPFLVEARANLAIETWRSVETAASEFQVDSLIDVTRTRLGDPLPAVA